MNAITRNTHAPSNDERRASWAARYFLRGFHRQPHQWNVTVPPSRADRDVPATPVRASPSMAPAHGSLPGQGRQSAAGIHSSPCSCGDDAQRHWALVARDLMAEGRESELTDTMRQAYDYEFCGVPEPEAPQIQEF